MLGKDDLSFFGQNLEFEALQNSHQFFVAQIPENRDVDFLVQALDRSPFVQIVGKYDSSFFGHNPSLP
jgi:hypothetical protein